MLTDDYKKKFDPIFAADSQFSKRLMEQVIRILDHLDLPKNIRDNCGTVEDFKGHDLTIPPIQIGVRIRRYNYIRWDEFTQDDKERDTMGCDVYFMGYATEDEKSLYSYIVFNYHDFKSVRSTPVCPLADRRPNTEHSLVMFSAWRNRDIIDSCRIYAKHGTIGNNKPGLATLQMSLDKYFALEAAA